MPLIPLAGDLPAWAALVRGWRDAAPVQADHAETAFTAVPKTSPGAWLALICCES